MELIEMLETKRRETGLSVRKFAELLGVSAGYYVKIRKGDIPVGDLLRRRTIALFPDLAPFVYATLSSSSPSQAISA